MKVSKSILLGLASLALIISYTAIIKTEKAEAFSLFETPLSTQQAGPLSFIEDLKAEEQKTRQPDKPQEKLYQVRSGDTLSKIARKHKTTVRRLYDANKNIKHPDSIKINQKIRIPLDSEKLKKRKLPKVLQVVGRAVRPTSFPGSFRGFDWGWCTYYAQLSRPDKSFRGDAAAWMAFSNSSTPKVGAVAVSTVGYYGHVAIVIGVKGNQVKVRHMNWQGFGVVSEDWTDRSYWSGYIY